MVNHIRLLSPHQPSKKEMCKKVNKNIRLLGMNTFKKIMKGEGWKKIQLYERFTQKKARRANGSRNKILNNRGCEYWYNKKAFMQKTSNFLQKKLNKITEREHERRERAKDGIMERGDKYPTLSGVKHQYFMNMQE